MIKVKKRQYIIKRHNICLFFIIVFVGDIVKVKIFDESHEEDLEEDINNFIKEVYSEHGCQIIINGVFDSLKYYY